MAGPCWMAVTLGLLLAVGNSSAFDKPDQNQLAEIVKEILQKYTPSYLKDTGARSNPMFSLAVSIPYNNNKNKYDISEVTDSDSAEDVLKTILRCEVYSGTRVVAATVLRWPNVLEQCPHEKVQWSDVLSKCGQTSMTWAQVNTECPEAVEQRDADHAEYRTLTAFNTLTNRLNKNDFMLFYVLASPCDQICTNPDHPMNILNSINAMMKWNNYAVVFSNVFKPRDGEPIPEEDLKGAVKRLGTYKGALGSIGLNNIFRCKGKKGSVACTSCSTSGEVTPYCYNDKSKPVITNLPSTSLKQTPRGRRVSPSRSSQRERDQKNNDINTNVDGNSGGVVGQGGSGLGVDSSSAGGKRKQRRGRGKKGKKTNEGEGVSSSQPGLGVRKTGGQVRKVGGRRVKPKRRGGADKPKSDQTQRKKKRQSRGKTQWSQEAQRGAEKQSQKRQKNKQPQRKGKKPRGGEMKRIYQPPKRKGKKPRRG